VVEKLSFRYLLNPMNSHLQGVSLSAAPHRFSLLHVISSIDPSTGGPAEGLRQICGYINHEPDWHAEVVTLDSPDAAFLSDFTAAPVTALGPTTGKFAYCPRLRPWLRQNSQRFDAIIIHGLWQYDGLAVWLEHEALGIPYFQFTHGMLDPWFKHTYPRKHLKKWLYWPWAQYRILRDAAAVLFTCEEEALLAPKSFWLYRANPVVVGYGIALPPSNLAAQHAAFFSAFPQLEDKRYLLFLGRIHPKKGCDLLLDAFSKIAASDPQLQLVMAGPGDTDFLLKLKQQTDALPISSRIIWTGMLKGDAKWGAIRGAEAFVLPSHQENFGVAVAEAMACATPVLISDKVNIWREIQQDGAGLVATDDLAGTIKLLSDWIALPAEAKTTMRSCTAASYAARFTIQNCGTQLLNAITAHIIPKPERSSRV
jgi:glycosyltransferase involved in cell wall biosynthesis